MDLTASVIWGHFIGDELCREEGGVRERSRERIELLVLAFPLFLWSSVF